MMLPPSTIHVLKFTDESGETHVSLHYDYDDANCYRARCIARMVRDGVVEDEATSDIITGQLLSGDFLLAYETFAQYCEHSEDWEDIEFEIRESSIRTPTTFAEIHKTLDEDAFSDDSDESAVVIIDMKKVGDQREAARAEAKVNTYNWSYMQLQQTAKDRLEKIAKSVDITTSGAKIETKETPRSSEPLDMESEWARYLAALSNKDVSSLEVKDELERQLANGYGDEDDDVDIRALHDFLRSDQPGGDSDEIVEIDVSGGDTGAETFKVTTGPTGVRVATRIDGPHLNVKKTKGGPVTQLLRGFTEVLTEGLTSASVGGKEEMVPPPLPKRHPRVSHVVREARQ